MKDFLISIVVPTYNSAKTLGVLLGSLTNQTYRNYEVIVVDKWSNDCTVEIAKATGCRIINNEGLIHEARNAGAVEARGECLLMIDSDHELEPGVLEECNQLANEGAIMAEIPEEIVAEGFFGKCRILEGRCYLNDDTIESPRFIKRDVFWEVGGYTTGDAEDWDLRERMFALGHTLFRTRSKKLHHEGKVRFLNRLRKKFIYTGHIKTYIKRNPRLASLQIPIFRMAFVRNWKTLARDPVHALGLFFMKAMETATFALGIMYHACFRQKQRIFK